MIGVKNNAIEIAEPHTKQDWQDYYHLRWMLLRQPWQQEKGSEQDELEAVAHHRMVTKAGKVMGVGRIHMTDSQSAQIRYMAVHTNYQRQCIGTLLLHSLEQIVHKQAAKKIMLHSREQACGFYLKNGYVVIEPSHILYGLIPHYLMEKKL